MPFHPLLSYYPVLSGANNSDEADESGIPISSSWLATSCYTEILKLSKNDWARARANKARRRKGGGSGTGSDGKGKGRDLGIPGEGEEVLDSETMRRLVLLGLRSSRVYLRELEGMWKKMKRDPTSSNGFVQVVREVVREAEAYEAGRGDTGFGKARESSSRETLERELFTCDGDEDEFSLSLKKVILLRRELLGLKERWKVWKEIDGIYSSSFSGGSSNENSDSDESRERNNNAATSSTLGEVGKKDEATNKKTDPPTTNLPTPPNDISPEIEKELELDLDLDLDEDPWEAANSENDVRNEEANVQGLQLPQASSIPLSQGPPPSTPFPTPKSTPNPNSNSNTSTNPIPLSLLLLSHTRPHSNSSSPSLLSLALFLASTPILPSSSSNEHHQFHPLSPLFSLLSPKSHRKVLHPFRWEILNSIPVWVGFNDVGYHYEFHSFSKNASEAGTTKREVRLADWLPGPSSARSTGGKGAGEGDWREWGEGEMMTPLGDRDQERNGEDGDEGFEWEWVNSEVLDDCFALTFRRGGDVNECGEGEEIEVESRGRRRGEPPLSAGRLVQKYLAFVKSRLQGPILLPSSSVSSEAIPPSLVSNAVSLLQVLSEIGILGLVDDGIDSERVAEEEGRELEELGEVMMIMSGGVYHNNDHNYDGVEAGMGMDIDDYDSDDDDCSNVDETSIDEHNEYQSSRDLLQISTLLPPSSILSSLPLFLNFSTHHPLLLLKSCFLPPPPSPSSFSSCAALFSEVITPESLIRDIRTKVWPWEGVMRGRWERRAERFKEKRSRVAEKDEDEERKGVGEWIDSENLLGMWCLFILTRENNISSSSPPRSHHSHSFEPSFLLPRLQLITTLFRSSRPDLPLHERVIKDDELLVRVALGVGYGLVLGLDSDLGDQEEGKEDSGLVDRWKDCLKELEGIMECLPDLSVKIQKQKEEEEQQGGYSLHEKGNDSDGVGTRGHREEFGKGLEDEEFVKRWSDRVVEFCERYKEGGGRSVMIIPSSGTDGMDIDTAPNKPVIGNDYNSLPLSLFNYLISSAIELPLRRLPFLLDGLDHHITSCSLLSPSSSSFSSPRKNIPFFFTPLDFLSRWEDRLAQKEQCRKIIKSRFSSSPVSSSVVNVTERDTTTRKFLSDLETVFSKPEESEQHEPSRPQQDQEGDAWGLDEPDVGEGTGKGRCGQGGGILTVEEIREMVVEGVLRSGDLPLAKSLLFPSPPPHSRTFLSSPASPSRPVLNDEDQIEKIVLRVAREVYDSAESGNMHKGRMKDCLDCLSILPRPSSSITQSRDFIEATSRLFSFLPSSTPLTPSQVRRSTPDKVRLISMVLGAKEDAYRHPELLMGLVNKLRGGLGDSYSENGEEKDRTIFERRSQTETQLAEIRTLGMCVEGAIQAMDWNRAVEGCEQVVERVTKMKKRLSTLAKRSSLSSPTKGSSFPPSVQSPAERHLLEWERQTMNEADSVAWKACYSLARQDDYVDTDRKGRLLGQALILCPGEQMGQVLEVFRRIEKEEEEGGSRSRSTGRPNILSKEGPTKSWSSHTGISPASISPSVSSIFTGGGGSNNTGFGTPIRSDSPSGINTLSPGAFNVPDSAARFAARFSGRAAAAAAAGTSFLPFGGGGSGRKESESQSPTRTGRPGSRGGENRTGAGGERSDSPRFGLGLRSDSPRGRVERERSGSGTGSSIAASFSNRFEKGVGWLIGADVDDE